MRHFTLAAFAMVALTACEGTAVPPLDAAPASNVSSENGLVPVDVIAMRDAYLSGKPAGSGMRLVSGGGRGYVLYANGQVDGVARGTSREIVSTSVMTSAEGNKVCVAPSGSWSGGCFEIWKRANGDLQIDNTYGNGRQSSQKVKGFKM